MENRCIHCKKQIDEQNKYFPFCSDKCSKIDLFRWLDNRYLISHDLDLDD